LIRILNRSSAQKDLGIRILAKTHCERPEGGVAAKFVCVLDSAGANYSDRIGFIRKMHR